MNDKIKEILEMITNNGFKAYVVGGYVRDYLRKIKTNDIDICTNARVKDLMEIFKDYKVTPLEYGNILLETKEKAKKLNADVICVNMHWGEEYRQTATPEQEELADFLFQNGVDLILGSHTHCLEPMEKRTVTLADGTKKDGFVIYSLGNFMSGQNANYTRQSVILDIQLTKKGKDNSISIDTVKYTPIYMYNIYAGKSMNRFKIMDIEEEIKKYDEGDTSIGAQLYNTLVSELDHVYKVVGNEIE